MYQKNVKIYLVKTFVLPYYHCHGFAPLKNPKWTPKNLKFENLRTGHKSYDMVQKDIWVQDILLLDVWTRGGGCKLKFRVWTLIP